MPDDGDALSLEAARKRAAERRQQESTTPSTPELPWTVRRMVTGAAARARERAGGNRGGEPHRSRREIEEADALLSRESRGDGGEGARPRAEKPKRIEIPSPIGEFPQPRPGLLPPISSPGTLDPNDRINTHSEARESKGQARRSDPMSYNRDSDDGGEGLTLSVRLLKERLELELGLKREGLRWLCFALLCTCYMVAYYTATAPHHRGEARWYVTQTVELDQLKGVSSPRSLYHAIMGVTHGVRDMTPLSSEFMEDPLTIMMVGTAQKFPAGPVEVPSDRRPKLLLEWTMTFRMMLDNPAEAIPPRRLIARQYMAGDITGGSCWAIYNKGYNSYILEHGSNTAVGSFLPTAVYSPDMSGISTNPRGLNFVALRVNATHANFFLEGAGQQTIPLSLGTLPSSCEGGNIEVGDIGLRLHLLQYHPVYLTDTELSEYQIGEYTVEDVASGTTKFSDEDLSKQAMASKVDVTTQQMINRYGAATLSVSRFSGTLAYLASKNTSTYAGQSFMPGADAAVGAPVEVNPMTGKLGWKRQLQVQDRVLEYWPVIDTLDEVVDLGYYTRNWDVPQEFYGADAAEPPPTSEVNEAFHGLYSASVYGSWDFTLSWWANAESDPGVVELNIFSLETNKSQFMVYNGQAGPGVKSWIMAFNEAPNCGMPNNTLCLKSPAVMCQRPDISGYDGIWRHYALRFGHGAQFSDMTMLIDGRELCTMRFKTDPDLIPHFFRDNTTVAAFGQKVPGRTMPGSNIKLSVKDMRLYHSKLNSSEIRLIAQDPQIKQCLDVEFNSDSSVWVSTFGQTCAQISSLSQGGVDGAPGACKVPDIQTNCPVSCQHELSPRCFDGVPPSNDQTSSRMLLIENIILEKEALGAEYVLGALGPDFAYVDYPTSVDMQLRAAEWSGGQLDADFSRTHNDIRKMRDGSIIASFTAQRRLDQLLDVNQGLWVNYLSGTSEPYCLGGDVDDALYKSGRTDVQPFLMLQMCETDIKTLEKLKRLKDVTAAGRDIWDATGWKYSVFKEGMLELRKSSTLTFWARIASPAAMKLTGVDLDNNVCFSIQSSGAWLQQHDIVSAYRRHVESGGDALSFQAPRFQVEVPKSAQDAFNEPDTWIFFALSINQEAKVVRFAVNGFVNEVPFPSSSQDTTWGCNSLHVIYNAETDLQLGPMQITEYPIVSGSMQQMYLLSRGRFGGAKNGEELSREDRLELTLRPVEPYTAKVFGIMPPLILQSRRGAVTTVQNITSGGCKPGISRSLNERLGGLMEKKCISPYYCENLTSAVECASGDDGEQLEQLFGMPRMNIVPFGQVFPDFAWGLHDTMIVRNGEIIKPPLEYINGNTLAVTLLMCFYAPSSKIATLIVASFDMKKVKVGVSIQLLQMKILTNDEIWQIMTWSVFGVIMAIIGMVLAWPAAAQEMRDILSGPIEMTARFRANRKRRRLPSRMQLESVALELMRQQDKKRSVKKYTADTTQPDVLDILINAAMIVLLIAFSANVYGNYEKASDVFSSIASVKWGSEEPINSKILKFVDPLQSAFEMVQMDEVYGLATFWILMLCCARMIIYMKLHPEISSIADTFYKITKELLNFMFSFLIVYCFLGYIAHVRFGYKYDEFATLKRTFVTQFALLIGDSAPDYSTDTMMCVYVVIFVFTCSLTLLNFLLAIVVDGYTMVTEEKMEKQVANGFLADLMSVPRDEILWRFSERRWPSKLQMLQRMQKAYPGTFRSHAFEDAIKVGITEVQFRKVVMAGSETLKEEEDAAELFAHYASRVNGALVLSDPPESLR